MRVRKSWILPLLAAVAATACKDDPAPAPPAARTAQPQKAAAPASAAAEKVEIDPSLLAAFQPLPAEMASPSNPTTPEKVALGRMLFHDPRFSLENDISCNSCHTLDKYGVDGQPTSPGHKGQRGERNSPTVYNAAGHIAQFWDGRAKDVEEQAKGPVLNPVEMAMPDAGAVVARIKAVPAYVEAFQKAFPGVEDPVTFDNFAAAIAAFERKLVTPSRWDEFLKGRKDALTDAEKKGFLTFVQTGCSTCHNGAYVGGSMFQKLGVVKPWPDLKDEGRAKVTGNEAEKFFFKVPSLRNIAKTGPYFHDGSVADLKQAVKMMAEYQLGKQLSDAEAASIVTWLESLTGELPKELVAKPELPGADAAAAKP